MNPWRLVDSGPGGHLYNMALDEALALGVRDSGVPVLRFYGWESAAVSIGRFQRLRDLDLDYMDSAGVRMVRRVTGGRGILHGPDELTYSFSAPSGTFPGGLSETYLALGRAFEEALSRLGLMPEMGFGSAAPPPARTPLCFGSSSVGELKVGGRKVVGSAQRRWPEGFFMQQGSIPCSLDYELMQKVFRSAPEPSRGMAGLRETAPDVGPGELKAAVAAAFADIFEVKLEASGPTQAEEASAAALMDKYGSAAWTQGKRDASSRSV